MAKIFAVAHLRNIFVVLLAHSFVRLLRCARERGESLGSDMGASLSHDQLKRAIERDTELAYFHAAVPGDKSCFAVCVVCKPIESNRIQSISRVSDHGRLTLSLRPLPHKPSGSTLPKEVTTLQAVTRTPLQQPRRQQHRRQRRPMQQRATIASTFEQRSPTALLSWSRSCTDRR